MGGVVKSVANVLSLGTLGAAEDSGNAARDSFNNQLGSFAAGKRPDYAQYTSQIDPATGLLKPVYQMPGSSAWQDLALKQQDMGEQGLRDQATAQGASAGADARSQLASRYGLRGGAAERLARGGQRDMLQADQQIARQGLGARSQIGLQGEQMGREAQKYNIENALQEQQRVEAAKLAEYQEKMKTYAAEKQAGATFAAGQSKGQRGGVMGGVGNFLGKSECLK